MMAMRNILLGPSGAPTPLLPYDAEVEYIDRDFGIAWTGTDDVRGGFDLSRYIIADEMLTTTSRTLEATFSFTNNNTGTIIAVTLQGLPGAFTNGYWMGKNSSSNTYRMIGFAGNSSISGDISTFHTLKAIADGHGGFTGFIDGEQYTTFSSTSTRVFSYIFVLRNNATGALSSTHMRVSSVKIGDTVDIIPVVKGSSLGFYNKVDGLLFLEEQACLSAGPRV